MFLSNILLNVIKSANPSRNDKCVVVFILSVGGVHLSFYLQVSLLPGHESAQASDVSKTQYMSGSDPGFLDRGFKSEIYTGGSNC